MQAFFLDAAPGRSGQRLCLYHPASPGDARAAIVYVHPLAEEMNKSRRMAALQARAFAAAGFAVLQVDLLGCGDSSGDFADATWGDWVDDVLLALRWMRARHELPLWLWGLRAGCLVASDAAARLDEAVNLLYWQPPASGRAPLQQFLRLAVVSEALGGESAARDSARQRLARGEPVDIAGYTVAPALASGLEAAQLQPARDGARTAWIELSTRPEAEPLPASKTVLADWRARGCRVDATVVNGPSFWQTTEIEDAPALIDASLSLLAGR